MKIRSRAPLRIGLAGGGTDLLSYSSEYGGAVFNATISMYTYCTITPTDDQKVVFCAPDREQTVTIENSSYIKIEEPLVLHKGVYNRIVKDFNNGKPLSFTMNTRSDVPGGSGLASSSTMVVTMVECYNKWLNLGLKRYEIARLAFEIELFDIGLTCGKQDSYSATFGGFNLMEFHKNDSVTINALRLDKDFINELEYSMILFYSGRSRSAASILNEQIKSTSGNQKMTANLNAMHFMKKNAYDMKNAFMRSNMNDFIKLLRKGWEKKKQTASVISNPDLDTILNFAMLNGAKAVKISGAGGGGFMMLLCDPVDRQKLIDVLKNVLKGMVFPVTFCDVGVESWIV